MKQKLLSDFTDTELLDLLDNTSVSVIETNNDIIYFIDVFKIQPGKFKILGNFLYTLYKDWSKLPVSKHNFNLELHKYLRRDKFGFFYIDKGHFTLLEKNYSVVEKKMKTPKEKSKNSKIHFEKYINYYGLESGQYYIEEDLLYCFYDKWCYKNKSNFNVLGKESFKKFLRIFFKNQKTTKDLKVWFGMNKDKIKIDNEEIKRLRSVYGKKKESTRKKQISSP